MGPREEEGIPGHIQDGKERHSGAPRGKVDFNRNCLLKWERRGGERRERCDARSVRLVDKTWLVLG